jgi:hypothetical protein
MNTEHHIPNAAKAEARGGLRLKWYALLLTGLSLGGMDTDAKELTPREAYNQGVQALGKGYLRESESWLLRAVTSQQESFQPPALYNLGHVRFQQGQELLKGESPREPLLDRSVTAGEDGVDAIARANGALKSENLSAIIDAYLTGRATRKEMRIANEDVQRALDLYGSVLFRWRRSVGDFEVRTRCAQARMRNSMRTSCKKHIEELLKAGEEARGAKEGSRRPPRRAEEETGRAQEEDTGRNDAARSGRPGRGG